jgi:hypothetical protein
MKSIRISDSAQFSSSLAKALAEFQQQPLFVLFFGTEDPKTNESW